MRPRSVRRQGGGGSTVRQAPGAWPHAALFGALLAVLAPGGATAQDPLTVEELRAMTIDDLADLEVTSVSRRAAPLSSAPAAIHVITAEDIRRLGATSLAEALRLAPGLQVARLSSLSHAISARGFNSTVASNKLLVMIDGRTLYSPLHSGVFWDAHDVMLDDVDRIEVVSGPGGALWGANAVNGVIHVVTRSAAETQGAHVSASYGEIDRDFGVRYGARATPALAVRGYLKGFERGNTINLDGTPHTDDWMRLQGGFRADWAAGANAVTVQADLYDGGLTEVDELPSVPSNDISGADVLARWIHRFGDGAPLEVQAYFDRAHRNQVPTFRERVQTWDVEASHSFGLGSAHTVVWGGGFRVVDDHFGNSAFFTMVEEDSRRTIGSLFVQDEIAVSGPLTLTAGLKAERHTYTGLEVMPNVRLAWTPSERMLWWAAVSRAVRTPSRLDRELESTGVLAAAPGFRSETLVAYEAGYRGRPAENATVSVSVFLNDYSDLRTLELPPSGEPPASLSNGLEGTTYGVEVAGNYALLEWWRLSGGLAWLRKDLETKPGVVDVSNLNAAGNDPSHQARLRSLMTLARSVELDLGLRVVDDLESPAVPGWVEVDARVGWHVTERLELAVTGFNLLDRRHAEGGSPDNRRLIRRTLHAGFDWRF